MSPSIQERIDSLFEAVNTLNADQTDLTWCVAGKPSFMSVDKFDISSSLSISTNSQEYKQVLRVRLNVDEIAQSIADDDTKLDHLEMDHLVRLLWSLAFFRLYSPKLVSLIESRIHQLLSSGTQISDPHMIMLLWSDAMLLQTKSVLDISLSNVSHYDVPDLINIMFAVTLVGKDSQLIQSCRDSLYTKLSKGGNIPNDFIVRYNRLVIFASAVLNEDEETFRRFLIKSARGKAKHRQPWKYTFELCLASHGTLKPKRLEVNPLVESVFPFDVSYTASRRKILLEVTRPDALLRDMETLSVVGVDGYTRLCRLALARLGYHVVNFSVSEWTSGGADMEKKMQMVKKRVRNCLKGKALFTGTERDTASADDDEYSDDSDMSY